MEEISCPNCGSTDIDEKRRSSYSGGGYADYWEELYCNNCNHEWESDIRNDFA